MSSRVEQHEVASRSVSSASFGRWLDSLLSEGEEPQPGAHIISPRRGYLHHGIYVGGGRVVHYAGLAQGLSAGPVEEVAIAAFARGRGVWSRWTDRPAYSHEEVIRRARSRVGENCYRLLHNNCEHFCEWCLRGESRSYQVERLLCLRKVFMMIMMLLKLRIRVIQQHAPDCGAAS